MKAPQKLQPYGLPVERLAYMNDQEIRFMTKPGAQDWNSPSHSAGLLAEHFSCAPGERILLIGCGIGALPISIALQAPQSDVWMMDASFLSLQMVKLTLELYSLENIQFHMAVDIPSDWSQSFDRVLICLSKGRKLAQRYLLIARQALRTGGILLLSGENNLGVKSMIADAGDIYDQVAVIAYKKGCRVACAVSSSQDKNLPHWAKQPGIQPGTWDELFLDTPAGQIHLLSLPGIFSFDRLDDGTQLLLTHLEVPAGSSVLDLGCGYGVIGLCAAKLGATRVDLVDDNLLAVAASRQNALNLDKKNVSAIASDVCSELHGLSYDLVLSNPPFHSGRKVDFDIAHAFIQQSAQVLRPGGRLLMVANRFIPYDEQMQAVFKKVNCVASDNRYRILQCVK